jgi:hypothetical protein
LAINEAAIRRMFEKYCISQEKSVAINAIPFFSIHGCYIERPMSKKNRLNQDDSSEQKEVPLTLQQKRILMQRGSSSQEHILRLYIGMEVMITTNICVRMGIANGSRAKVVQIQFKEKVINITSAKEKLNAIELANDSQSNKLVDDSANSKHLDLTLSQMHMRQCHSKDISCIVVHLISDPNDSTKLSATKFESHLPLGQFSVYSISDNLKGKGSGIKVIGNVNINIKLNASVNVNTSIHDHPNSVSQITSTQKKPVTPAAAVRRFRMDQFPLVPVFAITCHKTQGLTMPSMVLASHKSNTKRFLYVALSRVKKSTDLHLLNSLPEDIENRIYQPGEQLAKELKRLHEKEKQTLEKSNALFNTIRTDTSDININGIIAAALSMRSSLCEHVLVSNINVTDDSKPESESDSDHESCDGYKAKIIRPLYNTSDTVDARLNVPEYVSLLQQVDEEINESSKQQKQHQYIKLKQNQIKEETKKKKLFQQDKTICAVQIRSAMKKQSKKLGLKMGVKFSYDGCPKDQSKLSVSIQQDSDIDGTLAIDGLQLDQIPLQLDKLKLSHILTTGYGVGRSKSVRGKKLQAAAAVAPVESTSTSSFQFHKVSHEESRRSLEEYQPSNMVTHDFTSMRKSERKRKIPSKFALADDAEVGDHDIKEKSKKQKTDSRKRKRNQFVDDAARDDSADSDEDEDEDDEAELNSDNDDNQINDFIVRDDQCDSDYDDICYNDIESDFVNESD